MFQFQSGTIKASNGRRFLASFLLFQFQSGTIKAAKAITQKEPLDEFQFQSGTIKAQIPFPFQRRMTAGR